MSFNYHGLLNRIAPFALELHQNATTIHEQGRFHFGSFPIFQGITDLKLSYAMKMPPVRGFTCCGARYAG
jgi:hypothetical protein